MVLFLMIGRRTRWGVFHGGGPKTVATIRVESGIVPKEYVLFDRYAVGDYCVHSAFVNLRDHLLSFESVPARNEAQGSLEYQGVVWWRRLG